MCSWHTLGLVVAFAVSVAEVTLAQSGPDRSQIETRLERIRTLTEGTSAARQVRESGNFEAAAKHEEARALYREARASYEAEVTTPRPEGDPPTMRSRARPAPSGSRSRATWT